MKQRFAYICKYHKDFIDQMALEDGVSKSEVVRQALQIRQFLELASGDPELGLSKSDILKRVNDFIVRHYGPSRSEMVRYKPMLPDSWVDFLDWLNGLQGEPPTETAESRSAWVRACLDLLIYTRTYLARLSERAV